MMLNQFAPRCISVLLYLPVAILLVAGCDDPSGPAPDRAPPTLQITSPQIGVVVDTPVIVLAGTATDTRAVSRITYQLNEAEEREIPITAGGSVAFQANIDVRERLSRLIVHAYDSTGNRQSSEPRRVAWIDSTKVGFESLSANGTVCGLLQGRVYCWDGYRSRPTPISGNLTFRSVATASLETCGITMEGEVYCWSNTPPPEQRVPQLLPGGLSLRSLSAGQYHFCGLTDTGVAYCWGSTNASGQLGNGTTSAYPSPPVPVAGGLTFRSFALGESHTCGITTDGRAYCWGQNGETRYRERWGRLGTGTKENSLVPVSVTGGLSFQSLTARHTYTCGLTVEGRAYCWGFSYHGALGLGDNFRSEVHNTLVPTAVVGSQTFVQLDASLAYICGVTQAGELFCWGDAGVDFGPDVQPGSPKAPTRVPSPLKFRSVAAGMFRACASTVDGDTYCWGDSRGRAILTPVRAP